MTLEAFLGFLEICCLGRVKEPKPNPPPPSPYQMIAITPEIIQQEEERTPSPPDPRDTEWWSDFSLTEIESEEDSGEEEEEEPRNYVIVVDGQGNEHRVDLDPPKLTAMDASEIL